VSIHSFKKRETCAGNVTSVSILRWVEFQLIACEYLLIEDRRQFMDNIEEGNQRQVSDGLLLFGIMTRVEIWKEKEYIS